MSHKSLREVGFIYFLLLVSSDSGIPAMVDLAAMRDAVAKHGVDPSLVNPKCPTDLIVDHSLQIDYSKWCVCVYIFSFYTSTMGFLIHFVL